MKLSVKDRMSFGKIFGANKDDLTSATVQKSISKRIEFTEQEAKDICLTFNQGNFNWDPKKAQEIDFEFSETEIMYLKKSVFNADEAKLITQDILHICKAILMMGF